MSEVKKGQIGQPATSTISSGLPREMSAPEKGPIVRHPDLKVKFGIDWSFEHCSRMSKLGKFPPKVKLSYRCVGWFENDLKRWLAERAATSATYS